MTRYARIYDGKVVEIIETDELISSLYHPDVAATFAEVDGTVVEGMIAASDGTFTAAATVDLPTVKTQLTALIDRLAETERANFITPGAGQAMAYSEKAAQAKAWLAASDPVTADYPMLAAEVGITGETIGDVAAAVNAAYLAWVTTGAAIEAIRLQAKADIASAETLAAAQAIIAGIIWPSAAEGASA
ncbi:hypothetical protein [Martelella sp. HB161492]|uniref:hypothetical protein n=1 Tax=Martelella sp. HB161492 TaxID=2720726 RepID=UPI0015921D21|nr:hypothetical protein [Martelella sp. HB161492]